MKSSELAGLISGRAARLRLDWRRAAQFDDVAVMHVSAHGETMLNQLAKWLKSGSEKALDELVSSPPWSGNEGDADAPVSLLISLAATLRTAYGEDATLVHGVERMMEELAAAVDVASRERIRRLETLAATDSLTGAMSRPAILKHLQTESARTRRHGRSLSVVYMDVDGLKQVNDEHGHQAGDALLVELANTVRDNTRAADLLGRLGGDEFLLVLPETDIAGARAVVAKLKLLLSEHGLAATMGPAGTPDCEPDPDVLVETADASVREIRAVRA